MISSLLRFNNARAKASSCLSPREKFPPPAVTIWSRSAKRPGVFSFALLSSSRWTLIAAVFRATQAGTLQGLRYDTHQRNTSYKSASECSPLISKACQKDRTRMSWKNEYTSQGRARLYQAAYLDVEYLKSTQLLAVLRIQVPSVPAYALSIDSTWWHSHHGHSASKVSQAQPIRHSAQLISRFGAQWVNDGHAYTKHT